MLVAASMPAAAATASVRADGGASFKDETAAAAAFMNPVRIHAERERRQVFRTSSFRNRNKEFRQVEGRNKEFRRAPSTLRLSSNPHHARPSRSLAIRSTRTGPPTTLLQLHANKSPRDRRSLRRQITDDDKDPLPPPPPPCIFFFLLHSVFESPRSILLSMDLEYYWRRVPAAFGDWDLYGELPAANRLNYSAGLVADRRFFFGDEDIGLFKPAAPAAVRSYRHHHHHHKAARKAGAATRPKQHQLQKQGIGFDAPAMPKRAARRARGVPKAVDEDLYKIPPALLYQKPKRSKRMIMGLWSGCLGINCVA